MRDAIEILREGANMDVVKEGELTRKEQDAIRIKLLEIEAAEGITIKQMAKILGCSQSVWSQIRRNLYIGDAERYLLRGRRWMTERTEQSKLPEADYIETADGRNILKICQRAWALPCIGKVVLDSGAGKTTALKEFARRKGGRAVYLQCGEAASSKRGFLMELGRALGVLTHRASVADLYRRIKDRLADAYAGGKQTPFCLLIDEATTLSPACLNILRNLHDDEQVRCAVILADTRRLDSELSRRAGIAGGYEQLRSRFGAVYAPPINRKTSKGDVFNVAHSIVSAMGFRGKLPDPSVKFLHRLAQEAGRLRNVVYRLKTVADLAEAAKVNPTYCVAELDFVAALVGGTCELEHRQSPFGKKPESTAMRKAG